MKLYEFLENMFINTKIFEMAYNKKVAIQNVRNLQNEIATHLVKLIIYSDSNSVNHWQNEINAWLLKIQKNKLKGTGKSLSKELYYQLLFEEPLGDITDIENEISILENEYPNMKVQEYDARNISYKLSYVMLGVCEDMSNNKFKNIANYF